MIFFRKSVLIWVCASAVLAAQEPPKPAVTQEPAAAPKAPAAAAKTADADSENDGASVGIFYWYNPAHFHLRNGKGATVGDNPANLDYGGKNQPTPGAEIIVPAGKYNALRFTYFRTHGSGGSVTSAGIKAFGTGYDAGTAVSASYTLQNVKASWEYLSWPYPPKDRSFRLKTLWQIQYTSLKSELDAPSLNTDTTSYYATKSHWFLYPTIGIGLEKRFSRTVRWELQASGFAFPHRAVLWDAESYFAIRKGRMEVLLGGKAFHFKTTPKKPEYLYATLPGAFLEIRVRSKE